MEEAQARNGAIEGRRFVPFVGPEGDRELLQPIGLGLLLIFVAAAGLVSLRGDEERFIQLFGTHAAEIEVGELGGFAQERVIGLVAREAAAREGIGFAEDDPAKAFR